jgi:hypothetical protein
MQRIFVRKHDNLRPLCDLLITDADYAKLLKPPPLQDRLKAIVAIGSDGKAAAQIEITTAAGKLRLFPVKANGASYFVTSTPDSALANVA